MANIDRLQIPAEIGLIWFYTNGALIVGSADRVRVSIRGAGLEKAGK